MRWLALSVTADVEAVEAVSEVFGRLGRGSAVEPLRLVADPADEQALHEDPAAGYRLTVHIPDDGEAAARVDATHRALWHLQAFGLRPMGELEVTAVDDAEWEITWRKGYWAQRVGRLRIAPSWLDAPADDGLVIRLDPGMAFGTGLHPTTRACLAVLDRLEPMPDAVLDVGCGSGILGIAALRLGAARVVGYDTDAAAVDASRANAAANKVGDRFEVRQGTLPDVAERPFPLVMANLVATVLVEMAPRLAAHTAPVGMLVASGVIEHRATEVVSTLGAAGFVSEERIDDEDWVTLRMRRTP